MPSYDILLMTDEMGPADVDVSVMLSDEVLVAGLSGCGWQLRVPDDVSGFDVPMLVVSRADGDLDADESFAAFTRLISWLRDWQHRHDWLVEVIEVGRSGEMGPRSRLCWELDPTIDRQGSRSIRCLHREVGRFAPDLVPPSVPPVTP